MVVRSLLLSVVVVSVALSNAALGADMGTLEVMNGAEPAVSELNLAPCDTPDVRHNILENGDTIPTGSTRTFAVAPGCWIVSLKDGAVSAKFDFAAGHTEHYTLMES